MLNIAIIFTAPLYGRKTLKNEKNKDIAVVRVRVNTKDLQINLRERPRSRKFPCEITRT